MSITDRLVGLIFSDISVCLVLPLIFGVLIIAFPTVIADFLATIKVSFPSWLWGGPEIPLQHIFTFGVAQGLLSCGIPVFLGLAWNRWAGGASGFLLSMLYTLSSAAYFGEWFIPTVDWLGLIVSGMLAGYIAGALMMRSRMRGSTSLKSMLIASIVAAIVAIVFTTQTYIWYSPMFKTSINGMTYLDGVSYSYFINVVIYGLWAIIGAIVAKVASWFR
ncbi:MAG: hypothetical protein ACFFCW_28755 [Candidatus Hodarchaeota archaeon]